mgnify:CR=1
MALRLSGPGRVLAVEPGLLGLGQALTQRTLDYREPTEVGFGLAHGGRSIQSTVFQIPEQSAEVKIIIISRNAR